MPASSAPPFAHADKLAAALGGTAIAHLALSRVRCFLHAIILSPATSSRNLRSSDCRHCSTGARRQSARSTQHDPAQPALHIGGQRRLVGCVGCRHLALASITQTPWRGKRSNGSAQDHAQLGRVPSHIGLLHFLLQRLHVRFPGLKRVVLPGLDASGAQPVHRRQGQMACWSPAFPALLLTSSPPFSSALCPATPQLNLQPRRVTEPFLAFAKWLPMQELQVP